MSAAERHEIIELVREVARKDARIAILEARIAALILEPASGAGSLVAELTNALAGLEVLFRRDGERNLDTFERVGEEFLKDTGYLRPGKDCRHHSLSERQKAWDSWVDGKLVDARVALIHARALASGGNGGVR